MSLARTNIGLPKARHISLFRFFSAALETRRQRSALANLDAAARRDLGLSQDQIQAELARPVWDVPQYWLR